MWIPALLAEELGPVAVQDSGRTAALGAIAAMRPREIVEAQPGLQIRVEVRGGGVEAVAEGDAVVLMQAGALEALHEGVEVGAAGWQLVAANALATAGGAEGGFELMTAIHRDLLQGAAQLLGDRQQGLLQELRRGCRAAMLRGPSVGCSMA